MYIIEFKYLAYLIIAVAATARPYIFKRLKLESKFLHIIYIALIFVITVPLLMYQPRFTLTSLDNEAAKELVTEVFQRVPELNAFTNIRDVEWKPYRKEGNLYNLKATVDKKTESFTLYMQPSCSFTEGCTISTMKLAIFDNKHDDVSIEHMTEDIFLNRECSDEFAGAILAERVRAVLKIQDDKANEILKVGYKSDPTSLKITNMKTDTRGERPSFKLSNDGSYRLVRKCYASYELKGKQETGKSLSALFSILYDDVKKQKNAYTIRSKVAYNIYESDGQLFVAAQPFNVKKAKKTQQTVNKLNQKKTKIKQKRLEITEDKEKIISTYKLRQFIKEGQKEGYFPQKILRSSHFGNHKLNEIFFNFRKKVKWKEKPKCPKFDHQIILAAGIEDNYIECGSGDTIIIAGDGNDTIDDAHGNDIIYPGEGNDTIESSYGSDIVIFQKNWGHDNVDLRSERVNREQILGYDGSYPWEYSSFMVFGKGIYKKDMVWEGNTYRNVKTGDSVTLKNRNINILFAEEAPYPKTDTGFVPKQQEVEKTTLEELTAENVLVRENIGYFSRGAKGLYIVDLNDLNNTLILSKVITPGNVISTHVDNDIAYVTQGYEKKRGWVTIVDVKDPKNPIVLSTIAFRNNINDVETKGRYLYVPSTHFSESKMRILYIYNISDLSKPVMESGIKLNDFITSIHRIEDTLYLSEFRKGMIAYDISKASAPVLTDRDSFIKVFKWFRPLTNEIILGLSPHRLGGKGLGVYKVKDENNVELQCRFKTTGPAGENAVALRDGILIRAEGAGFSYNSLKDCKMLKYDSYNHSQVYNIFLTSDKAVSYDGPSQNIILDLNNTFFNDTTGNENPTKTIQNNGAKTDQEETKHSPTRSEEKGYQLMMYTAAEKNQPELIEKMCKLGSKPNKVTKKGLSPMHIASENGRLEALDALLKCGGFIEDESMILLTQLGLIKRVKILLSKGGNLVAKDLADCTLLHYMARRGNIQDTRFIIDEMKEQDLNINAVCKSGETALGWAERYKKQEVVEYLKKVGVR